MTKWCRKNGFVDPLATEEGGGKLRMKNGKGNPVLWS